MSTSGINLGTEKKIFAIFRIIVTLCTLKITQSGPVRAKLIIDILYSRRHIFFLQAPSYLVCMRMPLAGFVNGDGSDNLAVRPLTKYRNLLTALRSASPWAGDPYYVTGWA